MSDYINMRRQHLLRVEAVNSATTEADHRRRDVELCAWRAGVSDALGWDDADRGMLLMEADRYYLNQPEHADRPMCGGVWMDWTPAEVTP